MPRITRTGRCLAQRLAFLWLRLNAFTRVLFYAVRYSDCTIAARAIQPPHRLLHIA